jgi:uncharacterized protein (UPF0248 family)
MDGRLGACEVAFVRRGATGDIKAVEGNSIEDVRRGHIVYRNGGETLIPLHRIVEVRLGG